MSLDKHLQKDSLHHAYSIEGDRSRILDSLLNFFEKTLLVATRGNPDFSQQEYETFTVDDSRALSDRQKNKSFSSEAGQGRKIFVITFQSITHEAQNALLKVLEEPTALTHFFFIVPSGSMLIPTVRSRVIHIVIDDESKHTDAKEFLKMSYKERFDYISDIVDDKDKQKAQNLLRGLEVLLSQEKPAAKYSKRDVRVLSEISEMRSYLNDRSALLKLILESTALLV